MSLEKAKMPSLKDKLREQAEREEKMELKEEKLTAKVGKNENKKK